MKQDVDWAGNRVAQLQSHVQDVEDNENDDDNVAQNQDEHDGTNNDDDDDDVSSSLFSSVTLCSAKPFGRKTPWALEVVFEARC